MASHMLQSAIAVSLLCAQQAIAAPQLVFEEDFGAQALQRWTANASRLSIEANAGPADHSCLRIEDAGGNSQAFLRLAVEPGARYRLEVEAKRSESNQGNWRGCAAVSSTDGRGNQTAYVARSEFIGEPAEWHRLALEFTASGSSAYVILVGQNADGDVTWFADLKIFRRSLAQLRVLPPDEQPVEPLAAITLAGSPAEIGSLWGQVNAEAIRHDMELYYLQPARERGIGPEELVRRAGTFVDLATRLAPHWLAETEAVASSAGVDPQLYLAYVGTVYRALWAGEDCTSYAISPKYARDNGIYFHKNRDNQPKRQCAFLIDTDAPGVNRFISVSDASVISCMMMVNEKGLAGSADTGGLQVDQPRHRGWMNTALLRHIAERAGDCDQALAIVTEFVEKGWYAGGGSTGTHWLFVDARGRILEISNNSSRLEHQWHDDAKVYFSAARGPAVQRLQDAEPPVDFATFHNVSRDPAMCFPTSVSGMSVQIDRERPDVLTRVWISMPASSLSFPLLMGGSATPLPLINGQADVAGRSEGHPGETWEPIEALAFEHLALIEGQVRQLLTTGRHGDAVQVIDRWILATAAAHLAVLSE